MIWPRHPNLQEGELGIFEGHVFGSKAVLALPDVTLTPSTNFEDLQLDTVEPSAGAVLLLDGHDPMLAVRYAAGMWFFDPEAASITEQRPYRIVGQVRKWTLIRSMPDGTQETLCRCPYERSPA